MVRLLSFLLLYAASASVDESLPREESCADAECASHFLQTSKISIRGRQANSLTQDPVTTIKEFSCEKYANPSQMLGSEDGFKASSLDVKTGKYEQMFSVPFTKVKGGFKDLNACGVNPKDNMVYCHMKTKKGSFIVRLDEDDVEFVVKVKPAVYNTGGFSPLGHMFVATGGSWFIVVKDLHQTKGFKDQTDKGIRDLKSMKRTKPKGFGKSGDCVVVYDDLEKTGAKGQYVMVLMASKLSIAKWEDDDTWGKSWIIDVTGGKGAVVYGAGWNFGGRITFASNEGQGVFEIPMDELDLATTKTLELKKVGESDPNGNNDGLNCINVIDPWVRSAPLINCETDTRPHQIIKQLNGDYVLGELDYSNGEYEPKATILKNLSSPWIQVLNGAAVNPKDGLAYGALRNKAWLDEKTPSAFFIVRFNTYQIEYVVKVLSDPGRKGDGIAGSFDKDGNFFVGTTPYLYGFRGIADMKGFMNYSNPDIPTKPAAEAFDCEQVIGFREIADFVVVEKNFDGEGDANYLLGVNNAQDLLVVKLSKEATKFSKGWNLKVKKVTETGQGMNWGAAWAYGGEAYFAQNDGAGIFRLQLAQIDLKDKEPGKVLEPEIELVKVGKSVETHDNDGLNCPEAADPFAVAAGPAK